MPRVQHVGYHQKWLCLGPACRAVVEPDAGTTTHCHEGSENEADLTAVTLEERTRLRSPTVAESVVPHCLVHVDHSDHTAI